MTIYDKQGQPIFDYSIPITQDAVHEEELMKSDFVRLSWRATKQRVIPVDSYIIPFENELDIITGQPIKYSLIEPYSPEQKSEAEWLYEPQFQHPKMYLSKVVFERPSKDTKDNDITYIDWPYTGSVSTILELITDFANNALGLTGNNKFGYQFLDFADKIISVQFNSVDILSALTNVANACEVEWHIDWNIRKIFFGRISYNRPGAVGTPLLESGENIGISSTRNDKTGYWNAYKPQGSKRNIMRRAKTEEFIMSDVRLALDKEKYPDGIMYLDPDGNYEHNGQPITKAMFDSYGERPYVKPLIFEDVYPKMDLYVYDVRYREMYMLEDDPKDKEKKRRVVAYTDEDGEHYLKYALWYFKLARPVYGVNGEVTQWLPYKLQEYVYISYSLKDDGRNIRMYVNIKDSLFTTKTEENYRTQWEYASSNWREKSSAIIAEIEREKEQVGGYKIWYTGGYEWSDYGKNSEEDYNPDPIRHTTDEPEEYKENLPSDIVLRSQSENVFYVHYAQQVGYTIQNRDGGTIRTGYKEIKYVVSYHPNAIAVNRVTLQKNNTLFEALYNADMKMLFFSESYQTLYNTFVGSHTVRVIAGIDVKNVESVEEHDATKTDINRYAYVKGTKTFDSASGIITLPSVVKETDDKMFLNDSVTYDLKYENWEGQGGYERAKQNAINAFKTTYEAENNCEIRNITTDEDHIPAAVINAPFRTTFRSFNHKVEVNGVVISFDIYRDNVFDGRQTETLPTFSMQYVVTSYTCYQCKIRPYMIARIDDADYMLYQTTPNGTTKVNAFRIAPSDFQAAQTVYENVETITIVKGYGTVENSEPYKVSPIIDGTEPIIAFQPNTYSKDGRLAESTPLAGLGDGDGDGHYGFKVAVLGRDEYDLEEINKLSDNPEEGDTGIKDWITGVATTVDENDFQLIFEQNGAQVIPTTIESGIIPKGDSQNNRQATLFGNKVNMYNVITDDDAEKAASVELENETKKYIDEQKKDYNSYTFKSNPVAFEEMFRIDEENHSDSHLYIGQKVKYKELSDEPAKDCRVQKLITHLDYDYEQEITVGNAILKGASSQLRDDVDAIINGTISVGGGGGTGTSAATKTLIKNFIDTYALSKVVDDIAHGVITFLKGIVIGSKYGITEDGDATLHDISGNDLALDGSADVKGQITTNDIKSKNYTGSGLADTGWAITSDNGQGSSQAIVDYLVIRKKLVANALEIKETLFSAGDIAQTLASATIARTDYYHVDDNGRTLLGYSEVRVPWLLRGMAMILGKSRMAQRFLGHTSVIRVTITPEQLPMVNRIRCYFLAKDGEKEVENWFRPDDLARCQTWNVTNQKRETFIHDFEQQAGNVYWWRKIVDVSENTGVPRYVAKDAQGQPTENTTTDVSQAYVNEGGVPRMARNGVYSSVVDEDHSPVEIDGNTYHWFEVAYGYTEEQAGTADWCDALSDIPAAGDKVVQFGNTTDPDRMNIILHEVNGLGNPDAPDIKMYRGVYTFDLNKCWWGGTTCKFKFSPSTSVRLYAPMFEWITEVGVSRQAIDRNEKFWTNIAFERDDESRTKAIDSYPDYPDDIRNNGVFVSRADGSPKNYVRKCYYYNRVSHNGSLWLCSMANDTMYWRATTAFTYDGINYQAGDKVANYLSLPENLKNLCEHVRNYTYDEPTEGSNNWTNQVEKGESGAYMSRIFCRTNTTPDSPSNEVTGGYNTYTNPIPPQVAGQPTWSDGIPSGTEQIWTSTAWFYPDGTHSNWNTPQPESDTSTIDLEYSPDNVCPADPAGDNPNVDNHVARNAQHWYSPADTLPTGVTMSDMVWRAERKVNNGQYYGVWVKTRILGENAVKVDLSNENDSILYDNRGNKLSADVVTTAHLYDGASEITENSVTWSKTSSGCTLDANTALPNVKVTGLTADNATVTITAQYTDAHGAQYTRSAILSVSKIVNQDKYDLVIEPNALFLNESDQWPKDSSNIRKKTVSIKVTRIPASGGAPAEITPSNYGLDISSSVGTLNGSTLTITQDQCKANENAVITLCKSDDNSKVYDREAIPFNKASNGDGITSITRTYAISAVNTTVNDTTEPAHQGSWASTSPAVTENYPYLWAKEVVTFRYAETTTKYYCIGARGDNGIDAQDVEFVYVRTTEKVAPTIVAGSGTDYWKQDDFLPQAKVSSGRIKGGTEGNANVAVQCTDDPQGVDETWKYEWEIKRTKGAATNGHREWNNYTDAMTLHNNLAESIFQMDIDNEEDQFGTDSDSSVITQQKRSTKATMYYGSAEQTLTALSAVLKYSDDDSSVPSSVASVTATKATGVVEVTINVGTFAKESMYALITATCARGSKTARFTLSKLKSGKKGEDPVIYQLSLSQKSLSYGRDNANNLVAKNNSVKVNVKVTQGNTSTIYDTTFTDAPTFSWGYDNGVAQESGKAVGTTITIAANNVGSHTKVWFLLSTGDKEEVPIVTDGAKGASITKSGEEKTYQVSNSGTTVPTGTWLDEAHKPTPSQGQYLWTRTVITWSDNSTTTLYSVDRNPNDGKTGMSIVIDSQSVQYSVKDSGNLFPEKDIDDWGDYPATLSKGDWLYSKTTVKYKTSGGASAGSTVSYDVSYIGTDGSNGTGFGGITEHYKASENSTGETTPTNSDWGTNPMPNDWNKDKRYLWNYEKVEKVDGNGNKTYSKTDASVIAVWTENGKGIDSVTNFYKKANRNTGIGFPATDPDGQGSPHSGGTATGWSATAQVPDAENQYLWNYERITWIEPDGSNSYTYTDPHVVGHFGKDGVNAIKIDIDNDMDSIPCDSEGAVMSATTLTTKAKIYNGATAVTSGVTVKSVEQIAGVTATQSVSSGEATISWTIPKDAVMTADKFTARITLTYNNKDYSAIFTANVVKSGEPGVSPTLYQLLPSLSSIAFHRNSAGVITDDHIDLTMSIKRTLRETTDVISIATSGLTVRYSFTTMPTTATDGTAFPSSLSVTSDKGNVYVAAFKGATLIDKETIPVVVDGAKGNDGTSPYFADIDEEMDSIALNASGNTTAAYSKTLNISMWHGSTQLTLSGIKIQNASGTEISSIGNISITKNVANGTVTVSVATNKAVADTNEFFIKPQVTGVTFNQLLHFTLNGVRPGANGDHATLYRLVPSVSSVAKKKDGTYSVNNVSCTRQKIVGSTITDNTTDGTITYKLDGGTETAYTNNADIAVTSFTKSIQFIFKVDSKVVDRETIPLVSDGNDSTVPGPQGQNSISVDLDNEHEDFLYDDAGVRKSSVVTSQARLYDGATEVTTGLTWQVCCNVGAASETWNNASNTATTGSVAKAKISTTGLLTVEEIYVNTAKVKVRAKYPSTGSNYYYAEFTANKSSQDKYELSVNPSAVTYNQSTTFNTRTITLGGTRTDIQGNKTTLAFGTGATDISSVSGSGTLRLFATYVYQSGSASPSERTAQCISSSFSVDAAMCYFNNGIRFELRKYVNNTYTVVDYETLNIAKVQNGSQGSTGAAGIGIIASPAALIIQQDYDNPSSIASGLSERVSFTIEKGSGTSITPSSVSVTNIEKFADNTTEKFTVSGSSSNYAELTGVGSYNGAYASQGYFDVTITYSDGGQKTVTYRINVAVNLVGTWSKSIKGDMQTEIAAKTTYKVDGQNFTVQQDLGTFVKSSTENTSTLTRRVNNGKNLLPNVLTGTGWKSNSTTAFPSHNVTVDDDGWMNVASGDSYIISPSITLEAGKKYTFSYEQTVIGNNYVYVMYDNMGTATQFSSARTTGRSNKKFIKIEPTDTLTGKSVYIFIRRTSIIHPQLEEGEEATAFEASSIETSSQIKQTADQITAKVNATGVDITNGLIQLIANKTLFLTEGNVPMIAVQMCNANGEVGTGSGYTIPSIVFYNGQIGATGVSPQWVLNYLGFVRATNAGEKFSWDTVSNILNFEPNPARLEKYEHEGYDAEDSFCVANTPENNAAYLEGLANRKFYNEDITEVMYLFNSGYYIDQGDTKIYQPGDGIYYQCYQGLPTMRRYWLTNTVNSDFVPDDGTYPSTYTPISNHTASGYYYIDEGAVRDVEWPTDSDWYQIETKGRPSPSSPAQMDDTVFEKYSLVYFDANGVAHIYKDAFIVAMQVSTYMYQGRMRYYLKAATAKINAQGYDWLNGSLSENELKISDIVSAFS